VQSISALFRAQLSAHTGAATVIVVGAATSAPESREKPSVGKCFSSVQQYAGDGWEKRIHFTMMVAFSGYNLWF